MFLSFETARGRLSRIIPSDSFDQALSGVLLIFVAGLARQCRNGLLFLVFGCSLGFILAFLWMDPRVSLAIKYGSSSDWDITTRACTITIGFGIAFHWCVIVWNIGGPARRSPMEGCRESGYNLTGNVSGNCPECGTSIRPSTSTAQ